MMIINGFTEECYGCGVCAVACPLKIIDIKLSKDGFYEPSINISKKCIHCGLCETVCPLSKTDFIGINKKVLKSYSAFSNDAQTRYDCSSGGIAYELAVKCVSENGEVAAVRYNRNKHIAEHYVANSISELDKSRGSKYIQSKTVDGFDLILKSRSTKKMVFGTPCQISSFRKLIIERKKEADYVLVDIFCHGVPSMNLWKKYITKVESDIGEIRKVVFRDKRYGWHKSYAMMIQSNSKRIWTSRFSNKDLFYEFYLNNKVLNKQCHNCTYKGIQSAADIRLGDLWGKKFIKNQKGISAVIAFTEKGLNEIEGLNDKCTIEAENIETVTEGQNNRSIPILYERKLFLKLFRTKINLWAINILINTPIKIIYRLKRMTGI